MMSLQVFQGNTDGRTVVTQALPSAIVARFLRIHPKSWHGFIAMRLEFFGCTSGMDVLEACTLLLFCIIML